MVSKLIKVQMVFQEGGKISDNENICLKNNTLKVVNSFRYLTVHL
jgi:hypothetical protein